MQPYNISIFFLWCMYALYADWLLVCMWYKTIAYSICMHSISHTLLSN